MDKVTHFEIPMDDLERAKEFYSKTFGWQIGEVPGMPYWMCNTVECDEKNMPKEMGAINGGMYKRGDQGSKTPVVVIDVKDIDASTEKIKENGGEVVMEKTKVGDMGYYLQFKDSESNIMGLWQSLKKE